MSLRRPPRQISDDTWVLRTTSSWGLTVNAFLIRRPGELALIDSGFPKQLDDTRWALGELGLTVGDLDKIIYTHSHVDHMGGGVVLADECDVEHVFWEGTTPATTNYHEYYSSMPAWRDWLSEELSDGPTRETLLTLFGGPSQPGLGSGDLRNAVLVPFGGVVTVGNLELECVDGRGHDPFHAGWVSRDRGWLFSGDVVLRNPTPLLPVLQDDVTLYRRTLATWELEFSGLERLLPGHGREIEDVGGAVRASAAHLVELYDRVRDGFSEDGSFDPTEVVTSLLGPSPTSIRRAFITFGAVLAQLYELERMGYVQRETATTWRVTRPLPEYAQCPFA